MKINSIESISEVNKCQIKKRLGKLTLDDKYELMKILEKNKENLFYNISINLLIGRKQEAVKQFKNLTKVEKEDYMKYPISIYLKS